MISRKPKLASVKTNPVNSAYARAIACGVVSVRNTGGAKAIHAGSVATAFMSVILVKISTGGIRTKMAHHVSPWVQSKEHFNDRQHRTLLW